MLTSSTLQMDPKKPVRRVGAKPPPDRAQKAIGCLSLKNPFRSIVVAFTRISGFQLFDLFQRFSFNIALSCRKHCIAFVEWKPFDYFILLTIMVSVIIFVVVVIIFIIITRPKPAYGRQGLAGLWGQDTDQAGTFWGVVNISLRDFSAQLG